MNVSEKDLRKLGAIKGISLGVIFMLLTIISYYFITKVATAFWQVTMVPVLFSVIIPIIVAGVYAVNLRKQVGGYWSFKQATTGLFVMLAVSYVITYIGANLIFAKVIEPHMTEKTQQVVKNATEQYLEKSGIDQSKIDQQMDVVQKQFDLQANVTVGKTIGSFAISIIMMFVFALILAAIFKKEPIVYHSAASTDPTA